MIQYIKKIDMSKINISKIIICIILLLLPILIEIILFKNSNLNIDKGSVLRLGYQYFIYFLFVLFKILEKYSKFISKFVDITFKYRYFIALSFFIIMVGFKLNLSSIGIWENIIPSDDNQGTTIFGQYKNIRSDEWLVQTPFFLSQAMNNDDFYPQNNKNVRYDGQNMLMIYPAPVFNITLIGKPMNLGFILLGRDIGLSWYYAFSVILWVLMCIELVSIMTKKDKFMSLFCGFWLAFSPAVMWWLSSNQIIYLSAFAIIVIFNYYITNKDLKLWKKTLLAIAMVSSITGFVFCFYPPIQIPMMYIILIFLITLYIRNRKNLTKKDYLIMFLTLSISFAIIGYYIVTSIEDIKLILNTTYPGARSENGGDRSISTLTYYLLNFFTPFFNKDFVAGNESEAAAAIYPIIGLFVVMIANLKGNIKEKIKNKENFLLIGLVMFYLLQFCYIFIGFDSLVAKLTLFFKTKPDRILITLGITGMLLIILYLKKMTEKKEKIFNKTQSIAISIIVCIIVILTVKHLKFSSYLDNVKLLILMPAIFGMTYTFITANKKMFCYIVVIITIFTGLTINPITRGTGAIYNTKTSLNIQNLVYENPNKLWVGKEKWEGQYLIANGARTLNGVNYYPSFEWLKKLDPEGKFEYIYNRYAHIQTELGDKTEFVLLYPDNYKVILTPEDFKKLDIKFFLTNEVLTQEQMEKYNFNLVFMDLKENQLIYKIN